MTSKHISYILTAIIVAMLLFPPFVFREAGSSVSQGFGFVLSPPKMIIPSKYPNDPPRVYPTAIDTPQLFTQIFAVAIIGGIFLLQGRSKESK